MPLDISLSEVTTSVASLITDLGVPVTLTKVDTDMTYKTKGAFVSVNTAPPNTTRTALVQNAQSKLFLAAGRFVPEQGDLITMNRQDYRIFTVSTKYLAGKAILHLLELT